MAKEYLVRITLSVESELAMEYEDEIDETIVTMTPNQKKELEEVLEEAKIEDTHNVLDWEIVEWPPKLDRMSFEQFMEDFEEREEEEEEEGEGEEDDA